MGGCVGFAYEYELEDNGAEDKAADVEAGIHRWHSSEIAGSNDDLALSWRA